MSDKEVETQEEQETPLKIGSRYWTVYHNEKIQYIQVTQAIWNGDIIDMKRQREGRIFKNKNRADSYANSL